MKAIQFKIPNMKVRLTIICLIFLFILSEISRDSVRDWFLDVAIPMVLMTGFVLALRFPLPHPISEVDLVTVDDCPRSLLRLLLLFRQSLPDSPTWKESYFKSEESYQKQWQEKIDLEKNLSKLKNEKDILQEECSRDKQTLSINIEIQKKLANDDLEVAKQRIQELESRC